MANDEEGVHYYVWWWATTAKQLYDGMGEKAEKALKGCNRCCLPLNCGWQKRLEALAMTGDLAGVWEGEIVKTCSELIYNGYNVKRKRHMKGKVMSGKRERKRKEKLIL